MYVAIATWLHVCIHIKLYILVMSVDNYVDMYSMCIEFIIQYAAIPVVC